jgi:hypothetical protein
LTLAIVAPLTKGYARARELAWYASALYDAERSRLR